MSYPAYRLDYATKPNVVGSLPQLFIDYEIARGNDVNLRELHLVPPLNPPVILDAFFFTDGAIPTDLVSAEILHTQAGIFVNQRLKSLLEGFELGRHAWYEVPTKYQDSRDQLEYYFLHLCHDPDEEIDWPNSRVGEVLDKDGRLDIGSYNDFEERMEEKLIPLWKKVAFKSPRDCFRLYRDTNIYISPDLVQALEDNGITGTKVRKSYHDLEVISPDRV